MYKFMLVKDFKDKGVIYFNTYYVEDASMLASSLGAELYWFNYSQQWVEVDSDIYSQLVDDGPFGKNTMGEY